MQQVKVASLLSPCVCYRSQQLERTGRERSTYNRNLSSAFRIFSHFSHARSLSLSRWCRRTRPKEKCEIQASIMQIHFWRLPHRLFRFVLLPLFCGCWCSQLRRQQRRRRRRLRLRTAAPTQLLPTAALPTSASLLLSALFISPTRRRHSVSRRRSW